MKYEYLEFLCCPECKSDMTLKSTKENNEKVKEGLLECTNCKAQFEVKNYIPRFVSQKGYADSFGNQWKAFAKSQIDTDLIKESSLRFDTEIGWSSVELENSTVLEIGSGAGRFIEVISSKRVSLVIGMDITDAVDASQENIGHKENVFFIQGDIFKSPIKNNSMDFAYSIGVLHHTPDPKEAFYNMVDLVKDFGGIGLSLYEISLYSRPNRNSLKVSSMELLWALNMWRVEFFRIFTTRIPDNIMIAYCKTIIPILHSINKIPILNIFRYLLPSTCYRRLPVEWSMVDTMDTYSTKIVHQYRGKNIFQWFLSLGLEKIILRNGRAGWVSLTANKSNEQARQQNSLVLEDAPKIGNIGD